MWPEFLICHLPLRAELIWPGVFRHYIDSVVLGTPPSALINSVSAGLVPIHFDYEIIANRVSPLLCTPQIT